MSSYRGSLISAALSAALAGPLAPIGVGNAHADSEPYLGEVMLIAADHCPPGWLRADGNRLEVSANGALFSLLDGIYGPSSGIDFHLPDMRGRVPIHQGEGKDLQPVKLGQKIGQEWAPLIPQNFPPHRHTVRVVDQEATKNGPGSDLLAKRSDQPVYHEGPTDTVLDNRTIAENGGGKAFSLYQPTLAMTWCVAIDGDYPPRN